MRKLLNVNIENDALVFDEVDVLTLLLVLVFTLENKP